MRLILAFLIVFPLLAADPPSHFTGAGMGFQDTGTPRTSGWFVTCVQTIPNLYACLANDYAGGNTSTRAEAHQLLKRLGTCSILGTIGAGAATGASTGVGGSYDAGGVVACEIPQRIIRHAGIYATFSGSWQKNNVVTAPDVGTALRAFGQQTVWRFGFGKGW